ncbi:hypothetical protein [Actinomadura soli]|uniref:hypothetical protein n=1 Tax=Actinomadura soli TaxID=2508997 RepID=UPI001E2E0AB1|nr:hypothetical protein [Actinomadura soli]
MRIFQQGERKVDKPGGVTELGAGVAEAALQLAAAGLDLPQLELDPPLRHLTICS